MVRFWAGFDVGKAFHWVCLIDEEGEVALSHPVEATERELESVLKETAGLRGDRQKLAIATCLDGL